MAQVVKETGGLADWLDFVDEIDQDTIEEERRGYPYVQWVNGDRKAKPIGGVAYTGGWAIPTEIIGEDEEMPGWELTRLVHDNGSETPVWATRDITIAMIRTRRYWMVMTGDRAQAFPWNQYEQATALGKPRSKLQVLCLVRGLESRGALMLTLRGSFAQAFSQRRGESVWGAFNKCVLGPITQALRKMGKSSRPSQYSFWLTVGPQRNGGGEPVFTEVGQKGASSMVTLPVALGLRHDSTMAELQKLFVGKALIEECAAIYKDAEQWAHALDETLPEPETAKAEDVAYDALGEEIPF